MCSKELGCALSPPDKGEHVMKRGFFGAALLSVVVISCNGVGPFDNYVRIYSEEDLQKVRNNPGGNYWLMQDITLDSDATFEPIAKDTDPNPGDYVGTPFSGIFDGRGKSIKNLKAGQQGMDFIGFFGKIGPGGAVRNLKLSLAPDDMNNFSIKGSNNVGALAGLNEGTIENVGVEGGSVGIASASSGVGGLVGLNHGEIINSYAAVHVRGNFDVGGLVGNMTNGRIAASHATGMVTVNSNQDSGFGGLVGRMTGGSIEASHATGNVENAAGGTIGGLVGSIRDGDIKTSYATGAVTGIEDGVGGLVGKITTGVSIRDSYYALGAVIGTAGGFGGLVGSITSKDVHIINTYAIGTITGMGTGNLGGLVGRVTPPGTNVIMRSSYFDGVRINPEPTTHPGVGDNRGASVSFEIYYTRDSDQKVYTRETGGAVITVDSFLTWDFDNTWRMEIGEWPTLQWQAP